MIYKCYWLIHVDNSSEAEHFPLKEFWLWSDV